MNASWNKAVCNWSRKEICLRKDKKHRYHKYHCMFEDICEIKQREKDNKAVDVVMRNGKTYRRL